MICTYLDYGSNMRQTLSVVGIFLGFVLAYQVLRLRPENKNMTQPFLVASSRIGPRDIFRRRAHAAPTLLQSDHVVALSWCVQITTSAAASFGCTHLLRIAAFNSTAVTAAQQQQLQQQHRHHFLLGSTKNLREGFRACLLSATYRLNLTSHPQRQNAPTSQKLRHTSGSGP